VIINLGTNDFGPGDPGPRFGEAYQALVKRVRGHYPEAHLLCALGPVMNAAQIARAHGYLAPALGEPLTSYLEFPHQDGSLGYGCDWHPSRGTHQAMADRLVVELRRLLRW
jgi:lysophospholipase L1-like esterase